MNEAPVNLKELGQGNDSLSVYSKLLGLPERGYPHNVEETPKTIILPPSLLGSYLDFVQPSKGEKLTKFKESIQSVFWSKEKDVFIASPIIEGTESGVFVDLPQIFFGQKPIFTYHSHQPKNFLDREFVGPDVGALRGLPRLGYINTIATPFGSIFVFQTEKTSHLPVSATALKLYETFRLLIPLIIKTITYDSSNDPPYDTPRDKLARIMTEYFHDDLVAIGGKRLNKLGFATYLYTPGTDDKYFEKARKEGIVLEKFP